MDGNRVKKRNMVLTMRKLQEIAGDDNIDMIKGHSMRVAGSQHLAALGLALMLIQILARWGGSTILRYVAEAPLRNLRRATNN